MKERYDVRYKPLFNQAEPGIWEKFAEIEMNARAAEGCPFEDGALNKIIDNYHKELQETNNIAFGAFLNDQMIGFAKGHFIEDHEYKLDSLFVRHDMQRHGIGRNLIARFENSAGLGGGLYVQGQCFEWAIPFYKKQDYTVARGLKPCPEMNKELPKRFTVGVVPVFKSLCGLRAKIKVDYDKSIIKKCENQPVFVYLTSAGEIDAIAARTPEKDVYIWTNKNKRGMTEFYTKLLLNAIDNVK